MFALSKLVAYSSDESSEDDCDTVNVNNCNYELRDSQKSMKRKLVDDTADESNFTKLARLPLPMPKEVQSMFDDHSHKHEDVPYAHDGRIRSFPHERGVWPTFVYIEYKPSKVFDGFVDKVIEISQMHGIDMKVTNHFHVSLSRTLKLRHHWIPIFVEDLKKELRSFKKFKIMLQSTEVYINDEKTRTFVGLKIHYGFESLLKLLDNVDRCLEEFKLPFFHEEPSFHLSCAYCIGDSVEKINLFMADLNIAFQSFVGRYPECRTVWVENIHCKSGNKLFSFPLGS